MSGSMDELNIYNRALEAEEIKAIYDGSVVIIEKETLKAEIDAAESLEKDEYTEKSWKELELSLIHIYTTIYCRSVIRGSYF